MIYNYLSKH